MTPPSAPHLASHDAHAGSGTADLAAPPPAPELESNPFAPPTGASTPADADASDATSQVRVMIRLSDGDKVDAGSYKNEGAAIERARSLIGALEAQGGMEWPFLNGRFLRPETIVSIDLVEERQRY